MLVTHDDRRAARWHFDVDYRRGGRFPLDANGPSHGVLKIACVARAALLLAARAGHGGTAPLIFPFPRCKIKNITYILPGTSACACGRDIAR